MTSETTTTETAQPQEVPLITWKPNGVESGVCGFVGRVQEWLVQVWRPSEDHIWELILNLPGKTTLYGKKGDDLDDMKAMAERHVKWFIADITGQPAAKTGNASG